MLIREEINGEIMSKKIAKTLVQIVAGLIGLFGLFGIITFAAFLVKNIVQEEDLALPLFNGVSLILAGYFVYTGYQVLRNYSLKAVRHFCTSFFFLFLGLVSSIVEPWAGKFSESKINVFAIFYFVGILLTGYLIVKILYKVIAKYTLTDSGAEIT